MKNAKVVGLTYGNSLVNLSIFERPGNTPQNQTPRPDKFSSPRQGVLIARFNGFHYILVGNLPDDIMRRIVQSMH
jgi:negative regulator of sigma E activity